MDRNFIDAQRHIQQQTTVVSDYLTDLNDWLVLNKNGNSEAKNLKTGDELKSQGNALFSQAKFRDACEAYSEAMLQLTPTAVLYCNRALCYWHLAQYNECYNDCKASLKLNFSIKALFRKSKADVKLERWDEARLDTQKCLSICLGNAQHTQLCNELEEQLAHVDKLLEQTRIENLAKSRIKVCTIIPKWCRDRQTRSPLSPLDVKGVVSPVVDERKSNQLSMNTNTPVDKYVPRSIRLRNARGGKV